MSQAFTYSEGMAFSLAAEYCREGTARKFVSTRLMDFVEYKKLWVAEKGETELEQFAEWMVLKGFFKEIAVDEKAN